MKVVKFGGSSLADAQQVKKAADIICADKERRIVVVSAPGKRSGQDRKVTDLLLILAQRKLEGRECLAAAEKVISRFREIAEELGISGLVLEVIRKDLHTRITHEIRDEKKFIDLMLAAGEDNNAKLMAEYLCQRGEDAEYVNPLDAGLILAEEEGHIKVVPSSYESLAKLKERKTLMVFPGFFGYTSQGDVITFSRGGSDITGSILAAAVDARLYENFTDVDSVFAASPSIIKNPAPIHIMTYEEMRELAGAGFGVLHEEAVVPAWLRGIPINIKNTNNPEAPGTMIVADKCSMNHQSIVGIAVEKGLTAVNVIKSMMKYETGFERKLLELLDKKGINYEHLTSAADSVAFIMKSLPDQASRELSECINAVLKPDVIEIQKGQAVIMLIGHGVAKYAEAAGKACDALTAEKINVKMVSQNTAEGSILFEVEEQDADLAVRVLYSSFFNNREADKKITG